MADYKTLITYNHPVLGVVKCDANCYNAIKKECECICMGKNHGVGYTKARAYTTAHAHEMIVAYEAKLEDMIALLL